MYVLSKSGPPPCDFDNTYTRPDGWLMAFGEKEPARLLPQRRAHEPWTLPASGKVPSNSLCSGRAHEPAC